MRIRQATSSEHLRDKDLHFRKYLLHLLLSRLRYRGSAVIVIGLDRGSERETGSSHTDGRFLNLAGQWRLLRPSKPPFLL
jgi:hypothetical protein